MPVSPLSPRVSTHASPTVKAVAKNTVPARETSENSIIATVTARNGSKSITKIKPRHRLLLASIAGMGALGAAISIYIKGLPKFLKRKAIPPITEPVYVPIPEDSNDGLWGHLFSCIGGGFIGYFVREQLEHSQRGSRRFPGAPPSRAEQANTRSLIANGRNWTIEAIQSWATTEQTIDHLTLNEKLAELRRMSQTQ